MEDQVQSSLIVKTFPVGPLQCNCTLIGNPHSGQAILIDPGGDSEMLLQELSDHQLQLVEILHTHAHLDHFLASGKIKEATVAKLSLHQDDSLGHAGRSMQHVWNSL